MSTKTVISFDQFVSLLESALAVQFDGNAVVYPYVDYDTDSDGELTPTYVQIAYWSDGDEYEYNFYPADSDDCDILKIQEIFVENGVIVVVTTDENFTFRLLDTMEIKLAVPFLKDL